MVDDHPFQQHFKATCDFLVPLTRMCLLLFKQLIGQQMVRFQNSILKCLHHHTFSNMLSDRIFEAHYARILSCFRPMAGTWLITQLIILAFQLFISHNFEHGSK
jgi:hypothetical protein